jgi:hypothetical protein
MASFAVVLIVACQVVSNLVSPKPAKLPQAPNGHTYSVGFFEYGLSADSVWTVIFNGTTYRGQSASITLYGAEDGNYSYSIGEVEGYIASPSSGFVIVNGSNVNQVIAFRPVGVPST